MAVDLPGNEMVREVWLKWLVVSMPEMYDWSSQ